MDKKQLTEEYIKLFGKKPFGAWDETELNKKIAEGANNLAIQATEKKKAWDEMTEKERIEEAKLINSGFYIEKKAITKIVPVFVTNKKTGQPEPFAIIENKYIPWKEAEIFVEENKIKISQARIKELTCA